MNFSFSPELISELRARGGRHQIAEVRLFEKYEFNKEESMMYSPLPRERTYQDQPTSIPRYCMCNISR